MSGKYGTRRRGAVLIEFAFSVIALIFVMLGILEFAWLAHNNLKLANAARDGARDAAIGATPTQIQDRIKSRLAGIPNLNNLVIDLKKSDQTGYANTTYTYGSPLGERDSTTTPVHKVNDAVPDQLIQVKLSIPHRALTGNLTPLGSRTLQIAVTMRREANG
jgi:Flp pilus assembly protein TadG